MPWLLAGAAVGGIGSLISGNSAAKAADHAADVNAQNTAATNAANLNLFNLSRGAPDASGFGHAVLPTYFGGNEQAAGQAAYDNFNRLNQGAQNSYNGLLSYQNALRPSLNSSLNAVANRFNGQDLSQRLSYAAPVFNQRLNAASVYGAGLRDTASAQRGSINTALLEALKGINAQRSAQGFLGGSTFDRNRMLASLAGARGAAAVNTAQANATGNNAYQTALGQNAFDTQGLYNQNLDNMGRPEGLVSALNAAGGFEGAPSAGAASLFNNATNGLNFFRIQPQAFQQQSMPQVTPSIGTGQIFGSALNGLGQLGQNYGMMQYFQGLQNGGYNPTAVNTATSFGATSNPYLSGTPYGANYGYA